MGDRRQERARGIGGRRHRQAFKAQAEVVCLHACAAVVLGERRPACPIGLARTHFDPTGRGDARGAAMQRLLGHIASSGMPCRCGFHRNRVGSPHHFCTLRCALTGLRDATHQPCHKDNEVPRTRADPAQTSAQYQEHRNDTALPKHNRYGP